MTSPRSRHQWWPGNGHSPVLERGSTLGRCAHSPSHNRTYILTDRSQPGISPQRLYDSAWTDYTAGQWTLCIQGFETYLRSFPRSELADDAQFYIGECNYLDGKNAEAMDAYNRVINTYPGGDRVPEAYYKRGMTFERLSQPDQARESWETLIKTFPDSDMARLAKQNLDRLSRAKPPV